MKNLSHSRLKKNQDKLKKESQPKEPKGKKLSSPIKQINAGNKKQMQNYQISLDVNEDKKGLFDLVRNDEQNDENQVGSSSVIRTLTKYVTSKYTDEVSVKTLYEQKKMKEKIFDNIFQKFTLGQKLQKYDELKDMEELRKRMSA